MAQVTACVRLRRLDKNPASHICKSAPVQMRQQRLEILLDASLNRQKNIRVGSFGPIGRPSLCSVVNSYRWVEFPGLSAFFASWMPVCLRI
jgi:hypothetical protein